MTDNTPKNEEEFSEEFIESLFEKGPEITEEQRQQIEKNMLGKDHKIRMSLSLAVLTKSMKELCEIGEQHPDLHAELLEQTEVYLEDAKATLDFAEAACWRMRIVDCHVRAVSEGGAQS